MPKLVLTDIANVREFERELKEFLGPFAEKWGVTMRGAGGTFGDGRLVARIEFKPTDDSGELEKAAFARAAFMFGLTPDDYGRTFNSRGTKYMIVGFAPNRPKFPILCRPVLGGKDMLFQDLVLQKLDARS